MNRVIVLLSVLIISSACSSNDDAEPQQNDPDESFFGFGAVGTFWHYKYFKRVDNTEEFEFTGAESIMYYNGTNTINGLEYFILETETTHGNQHCSVCPDEGVTTTHVRDSLGYLINLDGTILFSSQEINNEYLINELSQFSIFGKLLPGGESLNHELLGTLDCIINEVFAKSNTDGTIFPDKDYIYYSEIFGEILRTYSSIHSEQHNWEKRLEAIAMP
jgi:hypothetical protein